MSVCLFRIIRLLCVPLWLFSASVSANNFNYHFFEFRVGSSPESLGGEYDVPLTDNFFVIGRLDTQFDHDGDLAGGIGFNGPVSDFIDVYGQALGHYVDYPNKNGTKDADILLELNIGARAWLLNQLEGYVRLGTLHSHTVAHFGLRFHSTDQLSFGAGMVNNGIWGPQIMMNVRAEF